MAKAKSMVRHPGGDDGGSQERTMAAALSAVGSLKAVNGVTVSTDLAGIISRIAFQSGGKVKKGDCCSGSIPSRKRRKLRSAEARHDLAKANLERRRKLVKEGVVSNRNLILSRPNHVRPWRR